MKEYGEAPPPPLMMTPNFSDGRGESESVKDKNVNVNENGSKPWFPHFRTDKCP